jgi:hypothetical protein
MQVESLAHCYAMHAIEQRGKLCSNVPEREPRDHTSHMRPCRHSLRACARMLPAPLRSLFQTSRCQADSQHEVPLASLDRSERRLSIFKISIRVCARIINLCALSLHPPSTSQAEHVATTVYQESFLPSGGPVTRTKWKRCRHQAPRQQLVSASGHSLVKIASEAGIGFLLGQSVSQCILGCRLSCIFTEQRRHYSTLPGPEKLVREPPRVFFRT